MGTLMLYYVAMYLSAGVLTLAIIASTSKYHGVLNTHIKNWRTDNVILAFLVLLFWPIAILAILRNTLRGDD